MTHGSLVAGLVVPLRRWVRRPALSLTIVLVVALAVGANAAIFSVVDAVLLAPLPYEDPSSLVLVWKEVASEPGSRTLVSPPDYLAWRERSGVFDGLGAYTDTLVNLTGEEGEAERLSGVATTPSLLAALGVRAIVGRVLGAEDERARPGKEGVPTMISESLWRRHFGGDPAMQGRTLRLDSAACEIVGVLPRGFSLPHTRVDVIQPLSFTADQAGSAWRNRRYLTVVARLGPALGTAQARPALAAIESHLVTSIRRPDVQMVGLRDAIVESERPTLLLLQSAVGLILLIAGANVAHLQYLDHCTRLVELATRQALGATRLSLMRQLTLESVALSTAGGLGAILVARWLMAVFVVRAPASGPAADHVALGWHTLGFAWVVAAALGLLAGLWSAVRVTGGDLSGALGHARGSTRVIRHRALNALVVSQIALSVVVLVGAGITLETSVLLKRVDLGFAVDGVVAMDLSLPASYGESATRARFFEDLVARIRSLPGLRSAAVTSALPLSGEESARTFWIQGEAALTAADGSSVAQFRRVSSDYFGVMGIRRVQGRTLSERDTDGAPAVVVVNQAFVRHFLPGRNALGLRLKVEDGRGSHREREIVGVVGDTRHFGPERAAAPTMYVSHLDRPWPNMTLVARVERGDPAARAPDLRRALASLDPTVVPGEARSMRSIVEAATERRGFASMMLGAFAVAALILSALGLHGLVAAVVGERTVELGVRVALGASPGGVVRLVLSQALRVLGTALAIGGLLSMGAAQLVLASLPGAGTFDPAILLGAATTLGLVGLGACVGPVWRALTADPGQLLK